MIDISTTSSLSWYRFDIYSKIRLELLSNLYPTVYLKTYQSIIAVSSTSYHILQFLIDKKRGNNYQDLLIDHIILNFFQAINSIVEWRISLYTVVLIKMFFGRKSIFYSFVPHYMRLLCIFLPSLQFAK